VISMPLYKMCQVMLRLNAHAAQDTYPQLVVCKVIEKVYRNTQNSYNMFIFPIAATLNFAAT
jgi:hypothetical protein